ncbi:ABC-2 family transporter protein [uncultured archaeon]|nr:ABC-2 family transporter protein [uncultured archaeon]
MVNLSGNFALFKATIKSQMAYKTDYAISLVFGIIRPLILLAVWGTIYIGTGLSTIGGLTLASTAAYFFLAIPVTMSTNEDVVEIMQGDIQQGAIASSLVKPMSYPLGVICRSLGGVSLNVVLLALPLMLLSIAVFHLALTPSMVLLFVVELIIGSAFLHIVNFIIATLSIQLTNVYGMMITMWDITTLLSGATIPLNFFPAAVQHVLLLLPFSMVCYMPVMTLLGMVSEAQVLSGIAITLAGTALLAVAAYFWWRHVAKMMGSAGG